MSGVTIWHNPRCSKSRAALALLEARGIAPEVRLYLKDPPTVAEIEAVLARLGIPAIGLMRRGEPAFRNAGLTPDDPEARLVAAMAAEPILIERPVVLRGERAVLGRPPEAVLGLV